MWLPILVIILLIIVLGGGGVALHWLWIALVVGVILWLLGWLLHPFHGPHGPRRWW